MATADTVVLRAVTAPPRWRLRHDQIGPFILATGAFFLLGMRQTFTVPMTFGLSLGQFLLYVVAAVWALLGTGRQRATPVNRWLIVAILGYLTASLLSYGAAVSRGTVTRGFMFGDRYIFADLALTAMVAAIITMLSNRDRIILMCKGLIVGATLSASFAILRLVTGLDVAPIFILPGLKSSDFVLVTGLAREGVERPQGSAGHPLELAGVLTVVLPLCVGVAMCARSRGERMWPWLTCAGIMLCGALGTVSRSVIVGLTAAVLIMAWRWPIRRLAAVLVAAAAAACTALLLDLHVVSAMLQAFANVSKDSSIASRELGAQYVTEHYRDQLWLGQGAGMYPAYDQPVLDNQYLSRLMETGVLGLASFVALLGVAVVLALKASASRDPVIAELGGAVSGSLGALVVISTILDVSGFVQIWTVTWILVALTAVLWRLDRQARIPTNT
ncbi:O-antigen ligase family protein [Mycolicibacterium smegmatis]|uniref:O-antigen ligase family protein n=1 Tax=Mycolicibacterium smegmatis TaxID=1772 RepID=UPI001303A86C|nr:O-antigen ligase family protein [Mycolicibacterium smegmatis]